MAEHKRYNKAERDRRIRHQGAKSAADVLPPLPPRQLAIGTILNKMRKPRTYSMAVDSDFSAIIPHAAALDEGYDPLFTYAAGSDRSRFNLGDGCRRILPKRGPSY